MKGRIYFEGNPWPEGHEIRRFVWAAEQRGQDIWFRFHLVSADYYEERDIVDDEALEYHSDWKAPIVWGNYHNCTISSDESLSGGFPACPATNYTLEQINGLRLNVDPLPLDLSEDFATRAFHIYLLGHDAVADHRIQFSRIAGTALFNISWNGKNALAYTGDYEPKYGFSAEIVNVPFPSIDAIPESD